MLLSSTSSSVELLVKNTMSCSVQAESNAAGPSMERKVVSQRSSAKSANGRAIAVGGIALNPNPDKMLHVRTLSADVPHTNMVWVALLQQYWATASGADEETFRPAPAARQPHQQLSVKKSHVSNSCSPPLCGSYQPRRKDSSHPPVPTFNI